MKTLSTLFAVVCLFAVSAFGQASYLSPGWYPQFAPVDQNGPDFQFVKAWLESKSGSKCVVFHEVTPGYVAPDQLKCTKDNVEAKVDAVLAFNYPSVSLIDLQRAFHMPLAYIAYTKPVMPDPPQPVAPPVKPTKLVGASVGGGWFACVPGDDSPNGTVFNQDGANYVKFIKPTPFGTMCQWMIVQ